MNISISGKNMDTGTAFQELAYDLLEAVISKYFKNAISGHITLEKSDAGFDVKGLYGQWGHDYPDRVSGHSGLSSGRGAEAYPYTLRWDWAVNPAAICRATARSRE